MSAPRDFPDGFLWGSATAAHQVEGDNRGNDWWAWEHSPGTLAAEPSADGIDHRNRYDEDFALLASLGQDTHRFSLEWSRIEPTDGVISQEGLAHYRRVLESLHRHGLTPVVTLQHKTLPLWFADQGGWQAVDALDRFARFAETVRDALGDLMPYVCSINEPQMIALFGYLTATFPPGLADPQAAAEVTRTLQRAHRRVVQVFREGPHPTKVGVCLQLFPMEPLRPGDVADEAATSEMRELTVDSYLRDLSAGGDVGDFVGLQYYTRVYIDASSSSLVVLSNGSVPTTQMGWEIHPGGFAHMLRRLGAVGLPVLVTENGIATEDDDERLEFLRLHLCELKQALQDGVPVIGYLYWSAFDNFEWNHGYEPTFGLIAIDRHDDLARRPRKSAYAFGELARTGRIDALAAALEPETSGAT